MGSLSCPFCCGGIHTTEENLRDHLMYVLYKPNRCPICRDEYFYQNKLDFIHHFILEHKVKGSSDKKIIQNTSGYVSIATSGALQKDLTLLPARDILYQRNENQNAGPTQEEDPLGSALCTEVEGKKNGCQIPDERSSQAGANHRNIVETKEISLESHRNQVKESLGGLTFYKCKSCGEMIFGHSSYLKHMQEQHSKKSNLSSTDESENSNISASSQQAKSLRLSSPQYINAVDNSPQSFHASSSSSSSHSPQLQNYSPVSPSQVPPLSSSSPVLGLPRKSSPNSISLMQKGSRSTSSQFHSPSGFLNKSWRPTIPEKGQERKLSPFHASSNRDSYSKLVNPDKKNSGLPSTQNKIKKDTNESCYGDAGWSIPRNWCLEKVKVKGPLTPDSYSVRSSKSQTSSINSPAASEQSIRSGKSWLSSINSPASSEQPGRERFSQINSPASSEFSYRSGKTLSSVCVSSPAPSEQSIAPSPLSTPRYLDANPSNVQESDDFKMLSHKHSLGYKDHVRSSEHDKQHCKGNRLIVKENTNVTPSPENKNIYLPFKQTSNKQHVDIHPSDNQQVINASVMSETCSTFNPNKMQGDSFESSLVNQEKFKQSYQRESDVILSNHNNVTSLGTDKNEVKTKSKDLITQSEKRNYPSSSNMKIQSASHQCKDVMKDKKIIESRLSDLSGNYVQQEPQSLQADTQNIKDDQNPDNCSASSPELLYMTVEISPYSCSVASPFIRDCNVPDTSHQEGPISNINKVVVDSTFDEQLHSQHFKRPLERDSQMPTTSLPLIQQGSTKTISQKVFDVRERIPKESLVEMHKDQRDIISAVDRYHKESISDLHTISLETSNVSQCVSLDHSSEKSIVPQECTNTSCEMSQEVISSAQIPTSQTTFIPTSQTTFISVGNNDLENAEHLGNIVNRNRETASEEYAESIVSKIAQISQEQDKEKSENKVCEQNSKHNLLVMTKMEHELIETTIEDESKLSLPQNTIALHEECMVQDYDDYYDDDDHNALSDISMRVGKETLNSYPHKKFRPDQERSIMQSLTVSVRPDQERSNMQSLTLAKLNRTFDLNPSEVNKNDEPVIEIDRKDPKNEGKEEYLSKGQFSQFICFVCGEGFQNQNDYTVHYNSHEIQSQHIFSSDIPLERVSRKRSKVLIEKKQLYRCDQCPKVFKKKYTLVRHNEEVHTENKDFVCEICNKKFGTKRSLENHNDTHLTEKNHKCPQCPHVCQTAGGLRSHISEIHNDIKNKKGDIKCDYPDCQEKFSKMYGLKRHIARKHSKARSFGCNLCPEKLFSCKEDLNNHCQSHKNKESMRCRECDNKQFKSYWALQRHTLSHNKGPDNKFKCPECSQVFTRRDSLVTHTNSKHKTKKSHECETCGQKFVRKNQLQVHQNKKDHTAEPQYSCDYCPKKFRFKDSYKRHITDKSCVKTEFVKI